MMSIQQPPASSLLNKIHRNFVTAVAIKSSFLEQSWPLGPAVPTVHVPLYFSNKVRVGQSKAALRCQSLKTHYRAGLSSPLTSQTLSPAWTPGCPPAATPLILQILPELTGIHAGDAQRTGLVPKALESKSSTSSPTCKFCFLIKKSCFF